MECSICLDDIEEIEATETTILVSNITKKYKNAKNLKCGHVYHKECIDEWLKKHHSCPYCRKFLINKFVCNIKNSGHRFVNRGIIYLDDNNFKELTIYVKRVFRKSYTLLFNRFNIISVNLRSRNKILLRCYKTLYNEEETYEIIIDKENIRNHIYESIIKIIKNHYISKSRITPSVVSFEEKQYLENNHEINNDNITYDNNNNISTNNRVRILSDSSSFSSIYSLILV